MTYERYHEITNNASYDYKYQQYIQDSPGYHKSLGIPYRVQYDDDYQIVTFNNRKEFDKFVKRVE